MRSQKAGSMAISLVSASSADARRFACAAISVLRTAYVQHHTSSSAARFNIVLERLHSDAAGQPNTALRGCLL